MAEEYAPVNVTTPLTEIQRPFVFLDTQLLDCQHSYCVNSLSSIVAAETISLGDTQRSTVRNNEESQNL